MDVGGEIRHGLYKESANRIPLPMTQLQPDSVETKASWIVASVALAILGMSFGAGWITAVALKDIASEVGGARSIPALASSLAWLGSGIGGIIMSRVADRVGTRWTVISGSLMIGLGLSISRSIVEAHAGVLRAENRAGGGAVFRMVLPVVDSSAPPSGVAQDGHP